MNIHQLTPTEASYLLFAIKKALRDSAGITPEMKQFYESSYDALSTKLQRCRAGDPQAETRHKYAQVRPTWREITLGIVKDGSPGDPGEDGSN